MKDVMDVPGIRIHAISDIYSVNMEKAVNLANNPDVKKYIDYRDMLENKDIDAVIIGTPDHWHAKMAIDASNAGKDVYLEKCLCRTLPEAKEIVKTIKKNKTVFQLGHQTRSFPKHLRAKEIYNSGILGKVTMIRMWRTNNTDK